MSLLKVKCGGNERLVKYSPNKVTIGGRTYPTVKIGNQIWMAENLDCPDESISFTLSGSPYVPRCSYYEQNEAKYGYNGLKCGLLYNGYAISRIQELCPEGWRVPTESDYSDLITTIGANVSAVTREDFGGSNESKFSAPLCGHIQILVYNRAISRAESVGYGSYIGIYSSTVRATGFSRLHINTSYMYIITNSNVTSTELRSIRLCKDA